jgi:transcriptional regulator with XRE-family HTH domain
MARKFSELRSRMSPDAQHRSARKAEAMLAAMDLRDLVRERGLTQEVLAERLSKAQGNVSRILRREDLHVSTLRDVVEAMGGRLHLTARFPDGAYELTQFVSVVQDDGRGNAP